MSTPVWPKANKSLDIFDIAPSVPVVVSDDVDAARNVIKPFLALYVGGMGAKGKNFYFDLVVRYGYADAAEAIQTLYLAGDKGAAAAAVPDDLVDEIALCGPKERIAERLPLWQASPITTLNMTVFDIEAVRVMAESGAGCRRNPNRFAHGSRRIYRSDRFTIRRPIPTNRSRRFDEYRSQIRRNF